MDKRSKREELLGELQDIKQMLDKPHTPGFIPTLKDPLTEDSALDGLEGLEDLDETQIPILDDVNHYDVEPPLLDPLLNHDLNADSSLPREDLSEMEAEPPSIPTLEPHTNDDHSVPVLDDSIDNSIETEDSFQTSQQDLLLDAIGMEPSAEQPKSAAQPTTHQSSDNPFLPKAILEKLASERHAAEQEAANALETLKPNHAIADQIDHNGMRHEIEIALDAIVQEVLNEYMPKIQQDIELRLKKTKQQLLGNKDKFRP